MDKIYSRYDGIASEKIDIGKYFEKYHEAISEDWYVPSNANGEQSIASFMPSSLGEEELAMLAEYCSIGKLTVPGEVPRYEGIRKTKGGRDSFKVTKIPQGTQLATLSNLETLYKTRSAAALKATRKYSGAVTVRYEKVKSAGPFAVPGRDALVYIRIYDPCRSGPKVRKNIRLSGVISVLGSQTLDKVRDIIDCTADLSIAKETSENLDAPVEPNAKDIYKSGFFYIEGTFYNDFREPTNEDNSEVIREWAEKNDFGPFSTARMEECRIDSLCVRFGYPWVYQHQGNCEHLLVFGDARLVNSDDELAISAYPRIERLKQRRCRYCLICSELPAQWIVTESDRIPHDPCYMCDLCMRSYNYIDGEKIGNFKAYRYPIHRDLVQIETFIANESAKSSKSKKTKKTKKTNTCTTSRS